MQLSTLKIGWRNLGRNKKRTALALLAIGVGQFALLASNGLMRGYADNIRLAITGPMVGHAQVHAPKWRKERALDLSIENLSGIMTEIRSDEAVESAAGRVYAPVLVAPEQDAFVAIVVGLDVEVESEPYGMLSGLDEPLEDRHVLLGHRLARKIAVGQGDEIAVVGQAADGSLANDLFIVQDIISSPADLINQSGVVMSLANAQELFVLPDQAHEIVIRAAQAGQAEQIAERLGQNPALAQTEIEPWTEIVPELVVILKTSDYVGYFVVVIVFIAAVAGIANTLMMATFERMHEFGMLLALGSRPRRLIRMIVIEAVLTGLLGVLIGTMLGYLFVVGTANSGIDMASWGGSGEVRDMAYKGLNLPLHVYPRLELSDTLFGLVAVMFTSLVASIWPAMKLSISTRYAMCSLRRHLRRTILAILGIGLGSAVCLFMIAFVRGEGKMMLKAAAESGAGHLRVVPAQWPETRENDLRLDDWENIRDLMRNTEGVTVVTPHARTEGLLAFGTRVAGVEILGVDPGTEQKTNRLVRNISEGHYLDAGVTGTTVIGSALAERLDVEIDDLLMVTVASADAEMSSAMLRIVGMAETGSEDIDSVICHVNLEDVENLTGRPGAADLTAMVANPKRLERMVGNLSGRLSADYEVVTWEEIMPELASGVKVDETWTRLTVAIVMIVVFLGIMSAQLAAVLERRREFAVLSAVGMRGGRLIRVMLAEGVVLGLFGSVLGLAFGLPAAYYAATKGIDFTKMYGSSDLAVSNVLFDTVFKGDFGWWLIPLAFELALTATVLSSLYPAWFAMRTDPAAALRVEQ